MRNKACYTILYASIIQQEAKDVNNVISDFLAFAKPKPPSLEKSSLNEIVQSVESMVEANMFVKGIRTHFQYSAYDAPVMLDTAQFKQVMLNIVQNAVESMDETENPAIYITTKYAAQTMQISIRDNGIGIPENIKHKIGTPFYTTKDRGTGLGLSICLQIIREHNGQMVLESQPGIGTCFTISIPCIAGIVNSASAR